ncbi:2'-phosphotransferase [Gregarina niphandrodes]|uniref:2'-phosphotransferase n=1 Tax=Gregarina niphandrodes TaxID=110365 RepID=A0A023B6Z9_GRENI|nr:2'-phosphotransferase [Gregarina niphandrodes]EZG66914.1 2'-phosphotransferase [Gregarina niphandrodes]|eukprot:XP_011130426.1 2'-phosphotransferase [Gregarina niphandrodes]
MRRAEWIRNEYTVCKRLCFLLRHAPSSRDLPIRRDGYVCALHLLAQPELKGIKWSQLLFIIRTNYKQRFGTAIQLQHLRTRTYRKQAAELSVVSNASDVDELTESEAGDPPPACQDKCVLDTCVLDMPIQEASNTPVLDTVEGSTPLRTLYTPAAVADPSQIADELAADELAADEPAADEPAADEPAADEPAADELTADVPEAGIPVSPVCSPQPFPAGLRRHTPGDCADHSAAGLRRPATCWKGALSRGALYRRALTTTQSGDECLLLPDRMLELVQDGKVQDGKVQDGKVQDRKVQDGKVQDRKVQDGKVAMAAVYGAGNSPRGLERDGLQQSGGQELGGNHFSADENNRHQRPFQSKRRGSASGVISSLPPVVTQNGGDDDAEEETVLYQEVDNGNAEFNRVIVPDRPHDRSHDRSHDHSLDRSYVRPDHICSRLVTPEWCAEPDYKRCFEFIRRLKRCNGEAEDKSRSPAYRRINSIKHLEGRFDCDDGNDSSSADESNEGAKASQLSVGDFTLREVSVWDSRLDYAKDLSSIWVRAFQGHSVKEVDVELLCEKITRANIDRLIPLCTQCNGCPECSPAPHHQPDDNLLQDSLLGDRRHLVPTCVHGTTYSNWKLIRQYGLSRMRRSHIHFAKGLPDELMQQRLLNTTNDFTESVHIRQNSEVGIYINLLKCIDSNIPFYLTKNHILISPGNSQGIIPPHHILRVIDIKSKKPVVDSKQ